MISVVGKRCRGTLPSRQKKKSRTDTRRASFSLISLYICALWSDHTLNIYLDVVVDWLVPRTLPAPTQSTRFDGSSPTGTCQRKKKKRKITNVFFFFFFCVCVMTVHVFICTATAALSVTAPCFHPAPHFLQEKRISGEKISYHFVGLFFLRYFVFSSSSLFIIVPIDWADWEDVVVSISLDPLFIFIQ